MTVRPLVPTAIRTEFGEVLEDASFYTLQQRDITFVPGYSNLRRARDLAKGLEVARRQMISVDEDEVALGTRNHGLLQESIRRNLAEANIPVPVGEIRERDVPNLPVRLQWVRTAKISGAPDSFKSVQYGSDGYREVTKADIGQSWLKAMPAGATFGVSESIHQGDCVLMVCDQRQSARNAASIAYRTAQMTKNAAGEFLQLGASKPGSDPSYSAEPGRTIKAPPSAVKA